MKIKKFFENEDTQEDQETYLDQLKKDKSEREQMSGMVSKRKEIVSRVTDAVLKSEKTKDKLFIQEMESLLDKHGF
jgi:hypothetical protein